MTDPVDRNGGAEVLQPVLAKVHKFPSVVEQSTSRAGQHDLPAVRGRGDPRGEVHVLADITLVGGHRGAGMQTDSNPDRSGRQCLGERLCMGGYCASANAIKKASPWGVDLDAAECRAHLTDPASMFGKRGRVRFGPELP